MSRSPRNRRLKLLAEDPHCYWCCREVREYTHEEACRPGIPPPEDQATIDHVNSRVSGQDRPLLGRQVLACPPCNQARARLEEIALGVEALRERSNRLGRHKRHRKDVA